MRLFKILAVLTGVLVSGGRAAAAQQVPLEKWGGLELFTGSLDADAAEVQGTADRMWGGQFNFGITAYRVLSLGVDAGFVGIRDRRSFTENTTAGEMESSVGGVLGSLVAGLNTPALALAPNRAADLRLGVNVGYTLIGADRSINKCLDCTLERVHIHAGEFVEPALQLFHGKGGLSARYRMYRGGADVRNALMIGYTFRAGKGPATAGSPPPGPTS
jgi:hypothetical protein